MNELAVLVVLTVVAVIMVLYALLPSRKDDEDHMRRRMSGKIGQASDLTGPKPERSTARQVLEKVAPYAMKPVMPQSAEAMSTLKKKLGQAGFRHESATRYFLASKTIAGIAVAVVALVVGFAMALPPKQVLGIAAFAGGVGFLFPNLWLSMARKQRMDKIREGLPDSLDLLVVSVESGLGLDAGLQKVSDEMQGVHPCLSEEMQIATLETQMGVPRAESLENMAQRCGVQEMRALVSVIVQAERFGTSVARALRTQADTLRTKRRLRAEERAQKTTVKLMLPLILFIFPSIFVVLVGPAAMRIMQKMGSGGGLSF